MIMREMDNIIIVRNKKTTKAAISTKFNLMVANIHLSSHKEFLCHYGVKIIMNELLGENFEEDTIESSFLYKKYLETKNKGEDNDYFHIMYKLRDDMAVKLNEHIHIYHLVSGLNVAGKNIVPWYYYDSKKYIADTWWESDEAILKDFFNISLFDFMVKYKGY